MFGLLLVDGLSMLEEQVIASLYNQLGNVPLVGGSAGDDLQFRKSQVYWDGQFLDKRGGVYPVTKRRCHSRYFRPSISNPPKPAW